MREQVESRDNNPMTDTGTPSRQTAAVMANTLQDAILNCGTVAIIVTDAKGVIQIFNVGAERMFGYAASHVVNRITPSELLDPRELAARAEGLSAEFAVTIMPGVDALVFRASRGIEDTYELAFTRKDGSRFPARGSIAALRGGQAEIIGYLLVAMESCAAQIAMIASEREEFSEEMFRLAVEACPNGMAMIDGDGKMVMVNHEIERQFGYRRDELIGQPVDMFVPARLRDQYVRQRDMFAIRPEARCMWAGRDLFGLRKDGSEFPVEVGLNPIRAGKDLMVLGVVVDISERKRAEQLKDEFVSTVSHELRTPLTSISGSLGLLTGQLNGKLPDPASRLLAIANKNSQRLVRLINDILDIEKLESGRAVFNLSRVDIRALVAQGIEDNRGFAEGYGVNVRLDAGSVEGQVNADPDRLAQVITNLLSNAIKFSPKGEEVLAAVARTENGFRISVRDRGPGIPENFKPRIFEKFAQADATNSRQKGGTGLGLSIVKQIVEWLGGEIRFDDAPGGGTVFHVDLPAWDGTAGGEIDSEPEAGAVRVLFCEDERAITALMRKQLRPAGYAVDFAYTVAAAVARADATRYAAILVDLHFPDGDGLDLILQLRGRPQYHDTPVIAIAGDPQREQHDVRSSRLNVYDWIEKPIDFENLIRTIGEATAPRPQRRARILHVDDDYDVLAAVANALRTTADVISVDSVVNARRVLATERIDLAVVDISLGVDSGLDLLPELRDERGHVIPVIIFTASKSGLASDGKSQSVLPKPNASLKALVAAVRDRLAHLPRRPASEAV